MEHTRPVGGYGHNVNALLREYSRDFIIGGDGSRYRARRKRTDGRPYGTELIGDTLDVLADLMDARLASDAAGTDEAVIEADHS